MPKYSLVIPVYNRPEEVDELLESLTHQTFTDFEVLIVEDGSTTKSKEQVEKYQKDLHVTYYEKGNSGPALARNYGSEHATGNWIIFLDSDCFVEENYLAAIDAFLKESDVDAFGGPDREHASFTPIQRGISYSMTSFLTTGGIRGSKNSLLKFKPRSFNMGVKRSVFHKLGGFRDMRFGEDIDLSLRVQNGGYQTALISEAFAYHKRRSTFWQFYKQVYNSGVARIVLNQLHPGSLKSVHFLPAFFLVGHFVMLVASLFNPLFLLTLLIFPTLVLTHSLLITGSLRVGFTSLVASYIQLIGYGIGFLKAWFSSLFHKKIKHAYVENFYE